MLANLISPVDVFNAMAGRITFKEDDFGHEM